MLTSAFYYTVRQCDDILDKDPRSDVTHIYDWIKLLVRVRANFHALIPPVFLNPHCAQRILIRWTTSTELATGWYDQIFAFLAEGSPNPEDYGYCGNECACSTLPVDDWCDTFRDWVTTTPDGEEYLDEREAEEVRVLEHLNQVLAELESGVHWVPAGVTMAIRGNQVCFHPPPVVLVPRAYQNIVPGQA